jgi:phosphatidate cytidylyltransferase
LSDDLARPGATGKVTKPVGISPGKGKYSELPLRVASAAVLGLFALYCTWMGGLTFQLLVLTASALIFYEFTSMVRKALPLRVTVFAAGFLAILFGSYLVGRPMSGLAVMAIGALVLAAWEWFVGRTLWGAIALVYAGLPFAALVGLRDGEQGIFNIAFVLACVWGADTFAYFAGKTLGGPKLAPAISPNKTWSGFFGGLIGAVALSAVVALVAGYTISAKVTALAILLALLSQGGDLFESWVKRKFGLKDSGWIIPGHGGLLDRIDGLIFAGVAVWLIAVLLSPLGFADSELSQILNQTFFTRY